MTSLPLLPPLPAAATVAVRNGRPISRAEFLHDILALADRLPATAHLLNLCNDRYLFAVGLFAAIARGIVSLLPNSTAPENIAALSSDWPHLICIGDTEQAPFAFPYRRVETSGIGSDNTVLPMPQILSTQRIACVFTSGSTGKPQPHFKTLGHTIRNAQAEAERLWETAGGACAVVGTVPFQHMYGLESTVLLPLLGGGVLTTQRPFFPADVATALAEAPEPRLLVTTPFHLRKLLEAEIEIPPIAALLSATAPLAAELAQQAETQLHAPMMEIYGATETGQIATRRPTMETDWECYTGVAISQHEGTSVAMGGHLEGEQVLNDVLELVSPTRFRLLGRNSDMINIAGKRSSLAYLNHIITRLPGVRDGAFCLPTDNDHDETSRLAAFVVAPGLSSAAILASLRPHLDPVFLPRPIVLLDSLPRNATGKIPAETMAELIAMHLPRKH